MTNDTIAKDVIMIDYGMPIDDMIAAGKYDWVAGRISPERFPVQGNGIVRCETKTFYFDRFISSKDAVEAIKTYDPQRPWEPAKIEALIAYGAKHSEEQRQYPIVGLGSVAEVSGRRNVPCLCEDDAKERGLDLHRWNEGWNSGCRFLAVRKLPSAP